MSSPFSVSLKKIIKNFKLETIVLPSEPENIYISDVDSYKNINPFSKTPPNHFWWGDSTYYSDYFYRQLELNGLSELNMESFKSDNVYFVTMTGKEESNNNVDRLLECLKEYHAVGVEKVDCIEGMYDVYRFKFNYSTLVN